MGRKVPFLLLAGLLAAPLWAMSKEAKAAYVAKIRAELQLEPMQVIKVHKLLDDLDASRDQIATAPSPAKRKAAQKEFAKRQEDGFRDILTPAQFGRWKKRYLPPVDPPVHVHK
jgi:hypothetical protein